METQLKFLTWGIPCGHILCQLCSQSHPEHTEEAPHDAQQDRGVADPDAVGPAEVAQGGAAALGGVSGHPKIHVGLRTVHGAFLGDAVPHVLAWVEKGLKKESWDLGFFWKSLAEREDLQIPEFSTQ